MFLNSSVLFFCLNHMSVLDGHLSALALHFCIAFMRFVDAFIQLALNSKYIFDQFGIEPITLPLLALLFELQNALF